MSLLISGSIAFDTIIQTAGVLRDQDLTPEKNLHISLFSPTVQTVRGGTAANIAYSLALLGKTSHIIAAVGDDAEKYLESLSSQGISTDLVQRFPDTASLQCYIVHDASDGQINIFHPGAMNHSGELSHGTQEFTLAMVAPDAPLGMMRRVRECVSQGIFTVFDPGQAMGGFSQADLMEMVELADISIMNETERVQFQEIVWQDFVEITQMYAHTAIVTLGADGAEIFTKSSSQKIPTQAVEILVDATGCGDAFRSGLVYGLSEGWDIVKSIQLGNIIGSIKIQSMGPQNHTLDKNKINTIGDALFWVKFFD